MRIHIFTMPGWKYSGPHVFSNPSRCLRFLRCKFSDDCISFASDPYAPDIASLEIVTSVCGNLSLVATAVYD